MTTDYVLSVVILFNLCHLRANILFISPAFLFIISSRFPHVWTKALSCLDEGIAMSGRWQMHLPWVRFGGKAAGVIVSSA